MAHDSPAVHESRRAGGEPSLRKNGLEWSVFAFSLLLIAGVLGFLGYHALQESDAPPSFHIELGPAQQRDSLYALPVVVHNTGDQTAAGVHVVVKSGGEEAELVFDYVPRHSQRQGTVSFRARPASPAAYVRSYSLP